MKDTKRARPLEGTARVRGPIPRAVRLLRAGGKPGELALDVRRVYTVGREAGSDIFFDDESVSRVHAHLKHEAGLWVVFDARSANGTYLAEDSAEALGKDAPAVFRTARRLDGDEPVALTPGDAVFFGDSGAALVPTLDVALDARSPLPRSARGAQFERDLERAAKRSSTVLLIGRSGSGKTWAASRIHLRSGRTGPFVALNAAALPEDPTRLRSVLLGHKKGAFTGADHDLQGAFYAAHQGTLFLDEVDSLHPAGQAFLLTLLEQSGDLAPLGVAPGAPPPDLDVRVIAASKTPLAESGLREDLAYRLVDGAVVDIPSLQDRREDIPQIIDGLLAALAREDGAAVPFDDSAVTACQRARWGGEVRQLRSLVRTLSREAAEEGRRRVDAEAVRHRLAAVERAMGGTRAATPSSLQEGVAKNPRHLTHDDIVSVLEAEGGNIQRTAQRLGIARGTLISKMDKFGIVRPHKR